MYPEDGFVPTPRDEFAVGLEAMRDELFAMGRSLELLRKMTARDEASHACHGEILGLCEKAALMDYWNKKVDRLSMELRDVEVVYDILSRG